MLAVSHRNAKLQPGTQVGVRATTKLATDAGDWRQINRPGHPMMWPIFWPTDGEFTNRQNTRHPAEDFDALSKEIGDRITVVAAGGNSEDPPGYGQTVADNAPEAMLSRVAGTATSLRPEGVCLEAPAERQLPVPRPRRDHNRSRCLTERQSHRWRAKR